MEDTNKENLLPKWREDFPYESENDEHITRRDFVRFLTLVSGGFAIGNSLFLLSPEKITEYPKKLICKITELAPGTWKTFNYPHENHPVLLARLESGDFVAFGQKCPHLACPIMYQKKTANKNECITCHCHNGEFDAKNGNGTKGPPLGLRPLTKVILKIENDSIYAIGVGVVEMKGEV